MFGVKRCFVKQLMDISWLEIHLAWLVKIFWVFVDGSVQKIYGMFMDGSFESDGWLVGIKNIDKF